MALLLNNEDARELLEMKSCVTALEEAYRDLGENQAVNRPETYIVVPEKGESSYSYCTMEGASRRLGVRGDPDEVGHEPICGGLRHGAPREVGIPACGSFAPHRSSGVKFSKPCSVLSLWEPQAKFVILSRILNG